MKNRTHEPEFWPLEAANSFCRPAGAWYVTTRNPGPIEAVIKVEGDARTAGRYARRIVACTAVLPGVPTADLEMISKRFPNDPDAVLRYLRDVITERLGS
jgi:hypothetical protein